MHLSKGRWSKLASICLSKDEDIKGGIILAMAVFVIFP